MQEELMSVRLIDRFISMTKTGAWSGRGIDFETLLNMLNSIKEVIIEENQK